MGLAQALKRKLGGGHANGQHKRPCQPPGSQPPPAAAASAAAADAGEAVRQQLANGGFAALLASHTGKNTRTAQRKQRKTAKQARQQAAQGQQRQRQGQGRHGAAAGSGSDSEGDGFASIANGAAARGAAQAAAGDGEEGQQQGAPAAAYSRLLGSLRSGGGAFTEALQQRQREQAGDSDASSGDESEDEGSDGEAGGSDLEGLSGSELSSGEDEDGLGGSEDEELGAEAKEGLQGGSEDEAGSSSSEAEDEDEGQQQKGQQQEQQQEQQEQQEQPRRHLSEGHAGAADAEAAAAAAAVEDHYLEHFEWWVCQSVGHGGWPHCMSLHAACFTYCHLTIFLPPLPCSPPCLCLCSDLSEDQAAALLDDGRRTRYLECSGSTSRGSKSSKGGKKGEEQGPAVAAGIARQWQHTALQAAEGTRLPQVSWGAGWCCMGGFCSCVVAPTF